MIVDGKARVDIGGRQIAVLTPGEFFGEIALLDGGPRTATVVADTDVVAEVIGQREFYGVLLSAPHLAGTFSSASLDASVTPTSNWPNSPP